MKPAVLLSVMLLLVGASAPVSVRELRPPPPASHAQGANSAPVPRRLSDTQLLELTQRQTFHYFWDFAHPVSGLARERSNTTGEYGNEVVTTGGSGFGAMAIVVATERG